MTDADLTHTIHFVIGRTANRLVGFNDRRYTREGTSDFRSSVVSGDPDERRFYALTVHTGWLLLGIANVFAIFVVAVPVRFVFGDPVGDMVAVACLAGAMFCLAGSANALWRMYWYVAQARRRARREGVDSEHFATSMRRTLPRNSSLIFQAAVGVLTFVVAL